MWVYEKKLEYPVRIKTPNPKLAKIIIAQYGGAYSINYYCSPALHFLYLAKKLFKVNYRRSP